MHLRVDRMKVYILYRMTFRQDEGNVQQKHSRDTQTEQRVLVRWWQQLQYKCFELLGLVLVYSIVYSSELITCDNPYCIGLDPSAEATFITSIPQNNCCEVKSTVIGKKASVSF